VILGNMTTSTKIGFKIREFIFQAPQLEGDTNERSNLPKKVGVENTSKMRCSI